MLPRRLVTVLSLVLTVPALCSASLPVIARGDRVDLERHLVPGKLVLVDFYADWCGPCRALNPQLERLASSQEDRLAVLKVDVVNWSSPVSQQYAIRSIPHLKLFDEDGSLLAEGSAGPVLAALDRRLGGVVGGGALAGTREPEPRTRSPIVPVVTVIAVLAAAALLVGRRGGSPSRRAVSPPPVATGPSEPSPDRASGGWFAMIQGSLDGPFAPDELRDLIRRGVLPKTARVRRRGDRDWRSATDLLDDAT